jgi:ribosomal protein S18 acetylase RimI-like enzyme
MTHKHEIVIERASIERETCHIGKLIVHPNHQNLGIGTILLSAAEQHFPEAQRYELFTGQESEKNSTYTGRMAIEISRIRRYRKN